MKFIIHHDDVDGNPTDSFIVSGSTEKECEEKAYTEIAKRRWDPTDCWSEEESVHTEE
jgi:hypothetical protein